MSIFGIGPLLAVVGGIAFVIVLLLRMEWGLALTLSSRWEWVVRPIGIMACGVGVWFWVSSLVLIKRAFKDHRLETSGVYRMSRNPLYAAFIVFIVPGIAFITNNLLVLFVSFCMFVCFKMLIAKEEEFLREEFGDEFEAYSCKVAQLIPFIRL